jgi:hypothetical protein
VLVYMINHVKFLLFEYHSLLVNMALNASIVAFTKSNLFLFIDVETFLGVECYYMSLLEIIHFFIKFAKLHDVFICDFKIANKICEGDVYHMYCDIHSLLEVMCLLTSMP